MLSRPYSAMAGTLGRLRRYRAASVLAGFAVAASAFIVSLGLLLADNAASLARQWGGGVQMVIYLDTDADRGRAAQIAGVLEELPAVEAVEYVSRREALKRVRAFLGEMEPAVEDLDVGMFLPALEVTLRRGVRDVAAVHPLVERLRKTAGIAEVELVDDWVDRVDGILSESHTGALWLLLLFALAGGVAAASAMRLGLEPTGEEMQLLRLVGTPVGQARAEVLLHGAVVGAVGSIFALAALYAFCHLFADSASSALHAAFGSGELQFLSLWRSVVLVLGGALLGGIAGFSATRAGVRHR